MSKLLLRLMRPSLGIAFLASLTLAPFSSDARMQTAGSSTTVSMTCLSGCRFDPSSMTVFAGSTVVRAVIKVLKEGSAVGTS